MKNMAFAGSVVSNGEGIGVVVNTGEKTFFGKTAALLEEPQEKSKFERDISDFSLLLTKLIVASILFIFVVNLVLGKGWWRRCSFPSRCPWGWCRRRSP